MEKDFSNADKMAVSCQVETRSSVSVHTTMTSVCCMCCLTCKVIDNTFSLTDLHGNLDKYPSELQLIISLAQPLLTESQQLLRKLSQKRQEK